MKKNKVEKKIKMEVFLSIFLIMVYFVWALSVDYGGIWLAIRHVEYLGLLIYFTCVLLKLFKVKLKVKVSEWLLMIIIALRLIVVGIFFITQFYDYASSTYYHYNFPLEALMSLIFQILVIMFMYEIVSKKTKFINNKIYAVGIIIYLIFQIGYNISDREYVGLIIIDMLPYIATLPYFYTYYKFLKNDSKDNENEKECEKCGKDVTISEFFRNDGLCEKCLIEGNDEKNNPKEISDKDWGSTLLLCIFTGVIGGHNFYVGKNGKGLVYLLTGGILGIGTLIDFLNLLTGDFKDANGKLVKRSNTTRTTNVVNQISQADELKKYKELLDAGIITQDEFEKKKRQILNL